MCCWCSSARPRRPRRAPCAAISRRFLADPRVVEIPRHVWLPILHGIILRKRPASSAAKYASIWTDKGSPLAVHTRTQALLLQGALGAAGHGLDVQYAMRYGKPSVAKVLREMRERNLARLLVLPMYPQYAASTTATAFDEVFRELATWRNPPELRTVKHFHDWPGYIDALAARIGAFWDVEGKPDKLVMSFHGVPKRTLMLGDPYHCECLVTARLLATRLGAGGRSLGGDLPVAFRQGRVAAALHRCDAVGARQGGAPRGFDVVCPGFVADCLETLEEIAIEGRHTPSNRLAARPTATFRASTTRRSWPRRWWAWCSSTPAGWPTRRPSPAAEARRNRLSWRSGASVQVRWARPDEAGPDDRQ